jgi:hypothetical protein
MALVSARLIAVAVALVLLGVGCSGGTPKAPKAFCESANRYEVELEREFANGTMDVAKQISLVRQLVATAPPAIHADAQRFLDALERVQSNPSSRNDPTVKRAHRSVDNVNRYASTRCGFFDQQPSGI